MHDDDLRARLASLIEPDAPTPAPELIRARGRRQRTFTVGAGIAALTTVAVLATGAVIGWPRVNPLVPVGVPSGPSVVPSPNVSTRTPTPTPTPSATTGITTPAASCADIRRAWSKAISSTTRLPASLGRDRRLEWVSGSTWVASGVVNGQRVMRAFPTGLSGSSYRVGVMPASEEWAGISLASGRVAFMRQFAASSGKSGWSLWVVDAPGKTPRQAFVPGDGTNGTTHFTPWIVGDRFRILEVSDSRPATFTATGVVEVDLVTPTSQPRVIKRFAPEDKVAPWGYMVRSLILTKADGTKFTLDQTTLAEVPVPATFDLLPGVSGANDRYAVYRSQDESDYGLRALDVRTGETWEIVDGDTNYSSLDGHLVLVRAHGKFILVDLDSRNSIEIMRDPYGFGGHGTRLFQGILGRDGAPGDPGLRMSTVGLPKSIPQC